MNKVNPTAEQIKKRGSHIKTHKGNHLFKGWQLWNYKRIEYVVSPDGDVQTRAQDNHDGRGVAIFPRPFKKN